MATLCEESLAAAEPRRVNKTDIAQRYHQVVPGSASEEELIKLHMSLVKNIVGRLAMTLPSHVDPQDLYSSGLVGLLNAVRNFDPTAGSTFESYARVRIRGAIFDELRRLDWVPRSVHEKARRVQVVIQRLEQSKGEAPTDAEIAKALDLSPEQYEQLIEDIRPAAFVCLDSARGFEEDADGSRYESISDESQENPVDAVSRRELAGVIAERLEQLPEMQRKVLALYYFEDMRLREIAEVFGVTESRICQIHAKAIVGIRAYLQKHDSVGS